MQEQRIPALRNGKMYCSLFLLILKDQRSLDPCLGDTAPKILSKPREALVPVLMYSQVLEAQSPLGCLARGYRVNQSLQRILSQFCFFPLHLVFIPEYFMQFVHPAFLRQSVDFCVQENLNCPLLMGDGVCFLFWDSIYKTY